MLRVFALLFLGLALTISCASTYETVYAPQFSPRASSSSAFSSSGGSTNFFAAPTGARGSSRARGGDVCSSVNPQGNVRPPPKQPESSSQRKTMSEINFALPTRQDFHNQFSNIDFFFDVANKQAAGQQLAGGLRQDVTVKDLPALFNQRVSLALFTIEPCGINLPHTHPRATEMLFIIDGDKVQVAFVEENGGRVIVNEISSGMTTFFPQGLMHYELNLACRPAKFVAILNHEDPGVLTASTRLFDIPPLALDTSLAIDFALAQQLRNGLSESPAGGRAECLSRCNLKPQRNSTVNYFTRTSGN